MTTTTELHAAIAQMQVLMTQAADVIEQNTNSLAEMHTRNGIIEDTEVQAAVESDTDLVAHLRAAALPWDQRHKSTERPQRRDGHATPEQRAAVRDELQQAAEVHGLAEQPAQRPWVGLTEEDREQHRDDWHSNIHDKEFRAIEAKLKEKNT